MVYVIIMLIFQSCANKRLEEALNRSGSNRVELENVLRHYSREPQDSLKLRAAEFLIENMPGHYSFTNKTTDNFFNRLDTKLNLDPITRRTICCMPVFYFIKPQIPTIIEDEDIKNITGDFLIRHIDKRFCVWQNAPWKDDISFDDFCKYILPYRVAEEPLEIIMREDIDLPTDKLPCYIEVGNLQMHEFKDMYIKHLSPDHIVSYDLPRPLGNRYLLDCIGNSYKATLLGRMMGIPIAIDYVPHWSNRNGRHHWNAIIDPFLRKITIAEPALARSAKIYRRTYHHNKIPIQKNIDYIPKLFEDPFNEDVTDQYIHTADIVVPCKGVPNKNKNVYLAIFNESEWQPIAWSDNKKGQNIVFEKLGLGNVYLPVCYNGFKMEPLNHPLRLNSKGDVDILAPDHNKLIDLTLKRKYNLNSKKIEWGISLVGSVIIASNDLNFHRSDTIARINNSCYDAYYTIKIMTDQKYRFWKIAHPNSIIQLSEIEFINHTNHKESLSICDPKQSKLNLPISLIDGNLLTYSTIEPNGIIFDLKSRKDISEVKLSPRNDDNYIIPGNEYELFYYDRNTWLSLGIQTAHDYFIKFTKVPSKALFILKCNSGGTEERIFTYENNKIIFW